MTYTEMRAWLAKTLYQITDALPDNATDADVEYLYSALAHHLLGEVVRWNYQDALSK